MSLEFIGVHWSSLEVIGGHWGSLEVIRGQLRSILGLFIQNYMSAGWDGTELDGWLSLVVGILSAPLVLKKIRNDFLVQCFKKHNRYFFGHLMTSALSAGTLRIAVEWLAVVQKCNHL